MVWVAISTLEIMPAFNCNSGLSTNTSIGNVRVDKSACGPTEDTWPENLNCAYESTEIVAGCPFSTFTTSFSATPNFTFT